MAINAFTVVSEFKFDVAGAIIGIDRLDSKVNRLSSSVDDAMQTVQSLGLSFIASFSGASGGILGLLGNAIAMSDKFSQSQLSFVQIIDSNMAHLSGSIGNVNEQMLVSRKIMDDIAGDARKFGLPADDLLQMTKTLSAMLVPKGLAGDNFGNARQMSRNLLKSAPNLGVDPSQVQGQLLRSIEGSASMGDTLFRRLVTEAPESFQQAGVKDAKGFNALDAAKRFNILNESLGKFANNAKILDMRANTLSGVMQSLRDLFTSFSSILKPLGDVIIPPLVEMLKMGINLLDNQGRDIVKAMARFLKPLIESPKDMYMNLMSLSNLAGDVAQSAGIVSLIVGLTHVKEILHGLSSVPIISKVAIPLMSLFDAILRLPIIGRVLKGFMGIFAVGSITSFGGAVKAIGLTLVRMAGLFGVLLIPITGLSRALERIKLDNMQFMADGMAGLIDSFNSIRRSVSILMAPIMDMITGWEELFYTLLSGASPMEAFKSTVDGIASIMETLTNGFLDLYAAFRGILAGITAIVASIADFDFSNLGGKFMDFGSKEFQNTVDRFRSPTLSPDGVDNAKVSNMVNNYDVTMNNAFKEVLQPDRIAFTIQEQLEKASQNKRNTKGFSSAAQQARSI